MYQYVIRATKDTFSLSTIVGDSARAEQAVATAIAGGWDVTVRYTTVLSFEDFVKAFRK